MTILIHSAGVITCSILLAQIKTEDSQGYGNGISLILGALLMGLGQQFWQPWLNLRNTQKQLDAAKEENHTLKLEQVAIKAEREILVLGQSKMIDTSNMLARKLERLMTTILVSHGDQKAGFPVLNLSAATDREVITEHYICTQPPGPKVLLIEDDRTTRRAVGALLSISNCLVHEDDNVDDGIQALEEFAPDYLVLDLSFPRGSGLDVIEHIRTNKIPTKVIIITSTAREDISSNVIGSAFAIFEKPLDYRDLVKVIRTGIVLAENQPVRLAS